MSERNPPSCFSSRIERVRRCNSLESVKLKGKIETLEAQRAIKHFIISREQAIIRKDLTKIRELKLPDVSPERRRILCRRAHSVSVPESDREKDACWSRRQSVHRRTLSEPDRSISSGSYLPCIQKSLKDGIVLTRGFTVKELGSIQTEIGRAHV